MGESKFFSISIQFLNSIPNAEEMTRQSCNITVHRVVNSSQSAKHIFKRNQERECERMYFILARCIMKTEVVIPNAW